VVLLLSVLELRLLYGAAVRFDTGAPPPSTVVVTGRHDSVGNDAVHSQRAGASASESLIESKQQQQPLLGVSAGIIR